LLGIFFYFENRIAYKLRRFVYDMGFWTIVNKVIGESDIVVFVLDARMPEMSWNDEIDRIITRKKKILVVVFNKIDLISAEELNRLKIKHKGAFFVSGINNIGLKDLKTGLLIQGKRMGLFLPRIGVVGYPNVGKSAIINALAHRSRAKVSAKSGTTRGVQYIKVGDLKILDSPGVVPYEDKEVKLGLLAAKNPEKLRNPEKVAVNVISLFLEQNVEALEKFYNIKVSEDPYDIFTDIGKKRGFLAKGGVVDERRTAITIVRDWQRGKIKL